MEAVAEGVFTYAQPGGDSIVVSPFVGKALANGVTRGAFRCREVGGIELQYQEEQRVIPHMRHMAIQIRLLLRQAGHHDRVITLQIPAVPGIGHVRAGVAIDGVAVYLTLAQEQLNSTIASQCPLSYSRIMRDDRGIAAYDTDIVRQACHRAAIQHALPAECILIGHLHLIVVVVRWQDG